jgi:hypothetical protein
MLTECSQKAMGLAHYEIIEDEGTYLGRNFWLSRRMGKGKKS